MMARKSLRIALLTAGIASATALLGVGTASAAGPVIGSNSGGANVRTCPNKDTCASIGFLGNGTNVTMLCWIDAQVVSPPFSDYSSQRWFRVASPVGTGYVHSSLVENQVSVGRC